jgi:Holliday junction resolvase-like predicted endonuclease
MPGRRRRRWNRRRGEVDHVCAENNEYVFIEGETCTRGADGKLAPTRRDQPPPDVRRFHR